jgi:hypothetical protein
VLDFLPPSCIPSAHEYDTFRPQEFDGPGILVRRAASGGRRSHPGPRPIHQRHGRRIATRLKVIVCKVMPRSEGNALVYTEKIQKANSLVEQFV